MLVFDGRFIRVGEHDGISRFSVMLIKQLSALRKLTVMICDERQLSHLPAGIDYFLECAPTSIREIGLALRLNKRGLTMLYSPMQTTGKLGARFKVVLTLHDLIYYQHREPPSEFNWLVRLLWRFYHLTYWPGRLMLRGARGVVTISETSLRLIRDHNLYSGPVEVIYNAGQSFNAEPRGGQSRKLCYMGSFMPYKDVETLIKGVGSRYELHLLSKITEQRRDQLQTLADRCNARVVFHEGVNDEQYQAALAESFALVSASRSEGFGIPIIEAMSLGVPVVCSDIAVFREVGGQAALFFAPGDPADLAQKLSLLETQWNERSKASIENAKRFSWEASAKKLKEFLDSVD